MIAKRLMLIIFGLISLQFYSFSQFSDPRSLYLDSLIQSRMQAGHIPGLSACIIKEGGIRWVGTYGYANFEWNIPVDTGTLFALASISKTPTVTALMQLWEDGLFDLDDDINDYTPFEIRNPFHPDASITFRMLCTHTSSIQDNWDIMTYYWDEDSPVPLHEYLFNYLNPTGAYYYPELNFYTAEPGTQWSYCNIAVMLLGYMVEVVSGIPFAQYCQENLFDPLEMNESSWFLNGLDTTHIAMPYHWDGSGYVPYGFYGYADYPAGLLRTNPTELGHFLISYMQHGQYHNQIILSGNTVDTILHPQVPDLFADQGLVWFREIKNGRVTWGHTCGDLGVATTMHLAPAVDLGLIVLTNGENYGAINYIEEVLFQYGQDSIIITDIPVTVQNKPSIQIYPNPFSAFTTISISSHIKSLSGVKIFDQQGRLVRALSEGHWSQDELSVVWDGKDERGMAVSPGTYIISVRDGEMEVSQRIVFIKP